VYDVTMPKLSDSMETGRIIHWRVKEGDEVHEGDVLAEVESDKAVMELECFADGIVAQIVHGDDKEVRVGETIALIAEKGEEVPTVVETEPEPEAGKESPPELTEEAEAEPVKAPALLVTPTPALGRARHAAISPYARKLAEEGGLDWSTIEGTGPDGRIVAADVQAAMKARKVRPSAPTPPAEAAPARVAPDEELPALQVSEDEADVQEASFRLRTQAQRVMASQHVIPHFYVTRGADVTRLLEMKQDLKDRFGATLTHVVMLACVRALQEHPEVNRAYDRGKIIAWKGIHLGLAVDTEQGLTVAVLRDAQGLSLQEIVERTTALVERARAGKLSADERRHPTFTITNLGMFDVEHFEPIINPPSSITLGVASALPTVLAKDDAMVVGKVMKFTAACDHRIIDGATAARFLQTLRGLLEGPQGLLSGR